MRATIFQEVAAASGDTFWDTWTVEIGEGVDAVDLPGIGPAVVVGYSGIARAPRVSPVAAGKEVREGRLVDRTAASTRSPWLWPFKEGWSATSTPPVIQLPHDTVEDSK